MKLVNIDSTTENVFSGVNRKKKKKTLKTELKNCYKNDQQRTMNHDNNAFIHDTSKRFVCHLPPEPPPHVRIT